jgi:hypothetical protein
MTYIDFEIWASYVKTYVSMCLCGEEIRLSHLHNMSRVYSWISTTRPDFSRGLSHWFYDR